MLLSSGLGSTSMLLPEQRRVRGELLVFQMSYWYLALYQAFTLCKKAGSSTFLKGQNSNSQRKTFVILVVL